MTTEKMTIHRALAELKVLDDRIYNTINDAVFFCPVEAKDKKIKGVTIEMAEKNMRSDYDKITDLIARRKAMKRALILSNAVTKVTIAGVEYTVAEAIEMKRSGIDNENALYNAIKNQYVNGRKKMEQHNEKIKADAERVATTAYGSKEKVNPDDFNAMMQTYIDNHTMNPVDPLDAYATMNALSTKISSFMAEVDAVLSESNALTTIEFQY